MGAQRVAEGREDRAAQQQRQADAQRQREPVVGELRLRPAARPDAEDAVVAAGDLDPLECGAPGDLREGHGEHGGVHARQPRAEPAERHSGQAGQQGRGEQP